MTSSQVQLFDLDVYLRDQSAVVTTALDRLFAAYPKDGTTIHRAMHYGVFPGGKRIRPILTLAAGKLFGGNAEILLPFACAVEMIHAYSLIHDDLPALDDDDLRRGLPTAHKVFGEGIGLLAGDGLLTEAFRVISAPAVTEQLSAELVIRLIHELSDAIGVNGLVGGQALDLEAENKVVGPTDVERIHRSKTGALIQASVSIGAQIARAPASDVQNLRKFGAALGLAFQIADDLLDIVDGATDGTDNESAHKEFKKATYPSVVGVARSREILQRLSADCTAAMSGYGCEAMPLRAIAQHVVARALSTDPHSTVGEIGK